MVDLHWYWRVFARLGLAEAAFAAGDLARAREEKQLIVDAVFQFDESMIQSLVWEFAARLSLAEGAREDAEAAIDLALHGLARFEVPHAAWRVCATAAAVHRIKRPARAERHVDQARAALTTLVWSLERCQPLRRSLVGAPAVNTILSGDLLDK